MTQSTPRRLAAALIILLAASAAPAQNVPAGWVAYYRPGGEVFVAHPKGWQVHEYGGGAFVVSHAGAGGALQALIYVKPQPLAPDRTPPQVLQRLTHDEAAMFAQAQVSLRAASPGAPEAFADLRFAFKGASLRGSALVVAHAPDHGTLFVISEDERTWPANAQTMARVLKSFKYMPPASALASPAGGAVVPPLALWRDPDEGAFTVPVPQGWPVQGGLKRPGGIDLRAEVQAGSPDGSVDIRIGDARVPTFGAPYMIPFLGQIPEGTVTAGATVIHRYLPGQLFLTQYYVPRRFGDLQNLRAQALPAWAAQSFRAAPPPPPMQGRADAGEVAFTLQTPNGPREFWYAALTRYAEVPGVSGSGTWTVETLVGVSAVPGRMALGQAVLAQMQRGFAWNPQWTAAEVRMRGEVAQTVIQHNAAMNDIVAGTATMRAQGGERAAVPRAEAARGEIRVQGADGQTLIVPNVGSQDYYRARNTGEIVATDRPALPPFDYDRLWRVR